MSQILGDFRETLPNNHEFLVLGFSARSVSLQTKWRNNGLSANFIADYLTTFFPTQGDVWSDNAHCDEIKSAVSYIANELLENAMKFSAKESPQPIRFGLHLLSQDSGTEGSTIILSTTNSISRHSVHGFKVFINEILTTDLDELYLRQVERSSNDEEYFSSGLGFITIKNDYAAQIGWKFESIEQETEAIAITTMVQLKI